MELIRPFEPRLAYGSPPTLRYVIDKLCTISAFAAVKFVMKENFIIENGQHNKLTSNLNPKFSSKLNGNFIFFFFLYIHFVSIHQ